VASLKRKAALNALIVPVLIIEEIEDSVSNRITEPLAREEIVPAF
jgi:hypothetical protein